MSTKETLQNLQNSKLQQVQTDQTLQHLEQISELLLSLTTLMQQQKPQNLEPIYNLNNNTQERVTNLAKAQADLKQQQALMTTNLEEMSQSLDKLNKTVGTMVTGYNKMVDQGVKVVEVEKQVATVGFLGWMTSTLLTITLILGPMYYYRKEVAQMVAQEVKPVINLDTKQTAKQITDEWRQIYQAQKR